MKKIEQLAVGVGMLAGATLAGCGVAKYEAGMTDYNPAPEYNQSHNTPEQTGGESFPMHIYAGFIAVVAAAPVVVNESIKAMKRLDDRQAERQNDRS